MGLSKLLPYVAGAVVLAVGAAACGDDDAGDPASARFTSPADGAEVSGPVDVTMEADGIDIVEAGEPRDGEGHFHIMVDAGCVEPGELITVDAEDEGYYHFGDASTEAQLDLEPGEYDLCLQVGDGAHTALALTDEIRITVTE